MPTFATNPSHCLHVNQSLDATQRFLEQCELISAWKNTKLTPEKLLGLSSQFTKEELKKAKMKMYLHFHPDKNKENKDKSTLAFQILVDAADYLAFVLGILDENSVKNNVFYRASLDYGNVSDDIRPTTTYREDYIQTLKNLSKVKQMTADYEDFLKDLLTKHPELLPLSDDLDKTIFTLVVEKMVRLLFFNGLPKKNCLDYLMILPKKCLNNP